MWSASKRFYCICGDSFKLHITHTSSELSVTPLPPPHSKVRHMRISIRWSFFMLLVHSHEQIVVAGSGSHLPSAPHTAVILPVGTNPGLHVKNISVSSSVFWYGSMEPSIGGVGSLQLAGGRNNMSFTQRDSSTLNCQLFLKTYKCWTRTGRKRDNRPRILWRLSCIWHEMPVLPSVCPYKLCSCTRTNVTVEQEDTENTE